VEVKSNEIMAIRNLQRALEVSRCIVTIDAIGCQTEITERIFDQEADYVLALKDNKGHMLEGVQRLFDELEQSHIKACRCGQFCGRLLFRMMR
jgi:predicted transposase YbfD/YdcC